MKALIAITSGLVVMIVIIVSYTMGMSYSTKEIEGLYFKNKQVEAIFKSDLKACNLKWNDTCGIGIIRIDDVIYYVVEPKKMVDDNLNNYVFRK